ncbi:MAG: TylF/MycF family methyltransferase [Bacteroidales bacterium]|jgi:hypothetical protein|nr:TylF/MycF family methyltransferase [Bacteroidales bacterium]
MKIKALTRKIDTVYKLMTGEFSVDKNNKIVEKDMDKEFAPLYNLCHPYTMTSVRAMYALYEAVKYVIKYKIEGDFIECGVWKGGSAMLMAATLDSLKCYDRKIYLYDTFEGMSEPSDADENINGEKAMKKYSRLKINEKTNLWCFSPLEEVKQNFEQINYPKENIVFVKGKVEDTIVGFPHKAISILRLDTDWYESTYHELIHLYPCLVSNGILIIDDYGAWKGAASAVDQYFKEQNLSLFLHRIDESPRLAVKVI